MKKRLLIKPGLFFLLILFFASCSNRGYKPISQNSIYDDDNVAVFNENFEKALYQTTINIFNNKLTGITLIKKIDSSYRVVSMSEIGVKYFDIEVVADSPTQAKVHYIMEMLDRKLLVKMLLNDFQLLFSESDETSKVKTDNKTRLIKNGKLIFYKENVGVTAIKKSRCLFSNKSLIKFNRSNTIFPDTILIDHGKINFEYTRIID